MGARILVGSCSWTDPTLIASGRFYPPGVTGAEDGCLRGLKHGRESVDRVLPEAGDGEHRTGDVVDRELPGSGPPRQVGDLRGERVEIMVPVEQREAGAARRDKRGQPIEIVRRWPHRA